MRYRIVSFTIAGMLIVTGIISLMTMPRSENPEFTIRQSVITVYYPGASELQIENEVTKPLERFIFGYKEVRKPYTYSTSKEGVLFINIELNEWVKDADRFWNTLQNGMNSFRQQNLPQNIQGPVINTNFGETVALLVSMSSAKRTPADLDKLMDVVEDKIKENPQVSRVTRVGGQTEQINIKVDDQKLSRYGVDYTSILNTLQDQNKTTGGGEIKLDDNNVPVYGNNQYRKLQDIQNQIIYTDSNGNNVRLSDVAGFERGYADTTQLVEMGGLPIMILSVEMQSGYNMSKFGKVIDQQLEEAKLRLPPDVKLVTFVDQPKVVQDSISHFLVEFATAIIAVIIVVLCLLPFKVALISAISCPLAILTTFAIANIGGLTLQQVTLAGLIIVLGMVVDDAIVVVDNYVEKLDHGVKPWKAAWSSATEIFVPVLTATISIIFAFAPMAVFFAGQQKEFVHSLPVIISIALASSFAIAMLIVPGLAYLTIKKGLHTKKDDRQNNGEAADKEQNDKNRYDKKDKKKGKSMLDRVQDVYDRSVELAFKHTALILIIGILAVFAGMFLMTKVPKNFLAKAERNQFNIELWLPPGTPFKETMKAVQKVEAAIKKDSGITQVVSFIGTSSPRFYTTYAPENPRENYAQIFISTKSNKEADELSAKYVDQFDNFLSQGFVRIHTLSFLKEKSPLEIRIFGDNIDSLKRYGDSIIKMVRPVKGTYWVHSDFEEDYMALGGRISSDRANRYGVTASKVTNTIGGGLNGQTVATLYEGKTPVNVVLRYDDKYRYNFNMLGTVHIDNDRNQKIQLNDVAEFVPEWHTGNIMHRNGIRVLTVSSEAPRGVVSDDMLKTLAPKLDSFKMASGYHIEYGGDKESTSENVPAMLESLTVSLVLIFLTMLVQFRSVKKTLIIFCTFPLSLLGASVGLLATGNDFGFTAFMGIISLIGIVVRNGIILVDYADEVRESENLSIKDAAIHAGQRRMRPIMLTTCAAAAGVIPMIMSKDPLWSPLGSVVGFGVIFSMFFTLFIVPVLYYKLIKPEKPGPEEEDENNESKNDDSKAKKQDAAAVQSNNNIKDNEPAMQGESLSINNKNESNDKDSNA